MSDAHHEQQALIRTPKQLIGAVAGFFLVIVIGIILLVTFVTNKPLGGAGSGTSAQEVAARVRPVADAGYAFKDANAPKILQTGQAVYSAVCVACHGTGAAGAPKAGDSGAWHARIAQGYDTLLQHAIQGIRAMPAKGGNPDLDDVEVARAVVYMTNESGAKFAEPAAAPAAAAPAAAALAPATSAAAPAAPTPAATPAVTPGAPPGAGALATPAVAANTDAGKALFNATCAVCHGAGIAGAPKVGDKSVWAPRIAQGNNVLYDHALKGFQGKAGVMPAKGGSTAPDADVKAAVDYMIAAVK
jgi:cytochrome c5